MFSACELFVSGIQFYTESCIFGYVLLMQNWGGVVIQHSGSVRCVVNTSKPLEVVWSLYILYLSSV